MHMGAENMAKKAAKRKNTRKNTGNRKNGGRNGLWIIFAGCCIALALAFAAMLQKPLRRHFSYPMEYEAEVRRACEKYDLDPCLVFAVIRTESFFTPEAVSGAGAQGLMQIMPETGEWIAWRQGKEYDESRIFEPDYNIDLGCWLLSFLLEKYNGDVELAAAAYNAGHSAVNRWLDDPKYYDGKNLTIPYEETENYVKKVKDAYEKYQFLRESEHEAGRE